MSVTTIKKGRFCNQIIRNLALSFLAEKYNLHATYSNYNKINNILGIKLYIGIYKHSKTKKVRDHNYMKYYNSKIDFKYNYDLMHSYFQTEKITNMIQKYLIKNKENIINKNQFKNRYNNNNDLFIHIRLDDAKKWNVGINYYINCINNIKHNDIYVASDNFKDELIHKLKNLFPKIILVRKNETSTIQFGSTCKNVVLSHGSFSAVIGYLSFFSEVHYPNIYPGWCPLEMFNNKGWNPINVKK